MTNTDIDTAQYSMSDRHSQPTHAPHTHTHMTQRTHAKTTHKPPSGGHMHTEAVHVDTHMHGTAGWARPKLSEAKAKSGLHLPCTHAAPVLVNIVNVCIYTKVFTVRRV